MITRERRDAVRNTESYRVQCHRKVEVEHGRKYSKYRAVNGILLVAPRPQDETLFENKVK